MKSQIKAFIIFMFTSFVCNRANPNNSQIDNLNISQMASELSHDSLRIILNMKTEYLDDSKITLSKCKTVYDANLNPIKYITISNNTNRSINGVEALDDKQERRIKVKIQLSPKSNKAIKNSILNCSSVLTGIFYANGEYESIASVESILGIKKNTRPKTYRVD